MATAPCDGENTPFSLGLASLRGPMPKGTGNARTITAVAEDKRRALVVWLLAGFLRALTALVCSPCA